MVTSYVASQVISEPHGSSTVSLFHIHIDILRVVLSVKVLIGKRSYLPKATGSMRLTRDRNSVNLSRDNKTWGSHRKEN